MEAPDQQQLFALFNQASATAADKAGEAFSRMASVFFAGFVAFLGVFLMYETKILREETKPFDLSKKAKKAQLSMYIVGLVIVVIFSTCALSYAIMVSGTSYNWSNEKNTKAQVQTAVFYLGIGILMVVGISCIVCVTRIFKSVSGDCLNASGTLNKQLFSLLNTGVIFTVLPFAVGYLCFNKKVTLYNESGKNMAIVLLAVFFSINMYLLQAACKVKNQLNKQKDCKNMKNTQKTMDSLNSLIGITATCVSLVFAGFLYILASKIKEKYDKGDFDNVNSFFTGSSSFTDENTNAHAKKSAA